MAAVLAQSNSGSNPESMAVVVLESAITSGCNKDIVVSGVIGTRGLMNRAALSLVHGSSDVCKKLHAMQVVSFAFGATEIDENETQQPFGKVHVTFARNDKTIRTVDIIPARPDLEMGLSSKTSSRRFNIFHQLLARSFGKEVSVENDKLMLGGSVGMAFNMIPQDLAKKTRAFGLFWIQ